MKRGRDMLLAVLVGLAALAVYLATMYPGLVGSGDTPELQFAGRVLGTAHTPGYPLYILLTGAFSHLPVGSVAYRINLMSGLFAAAAAACAVFALRLLGCRPAVAAAVALALAFGRVFWAQATLAEVYSLAAALMLALLAALLEWGRERREGVLLGAIALAALGLGHHSTDVVTVAPALVLYALLTDARAALRPKVLALGAALVAAGVAQYGFIPLRTWQHAPYLGARASSLGELLNVMRGGRFGSRLFVFDLGTILSRRVPAFGAILRDELGTAGLALLVLGVAVVVARRRRAGALLLLGAAGPAFFALNYDVPDVAVFLLPSLLLLWPVVGVGLETVAGALERARAPAGLLGALALLLPAGQLLANYRANDHHDHTFEMRYFAALVESLPARSAILTESYTVDQMLRYELLGEGLAARKEVVIAGRDTDSIEAYVRRGYALFAFERGRQELAPLGYRFTPITVRDGPLLAWLRSLPRGSLVLLAGSDPAAARVGASALGALGGVPGPAPPAGLFAAVGVVGARGPALARFDPESAEVQVRPGEPVGGTGVASRGPLRAVARWAGALVEANGRAVARVDTGIAAAVVHPSGRVVERIEMEGDLRVPFNRRAFPFFRLAGAPDCADVGGRDWVDVTRHAAGGRVLGRIDDYGPFDASLVLYLARERPFAPRLVDVEGRGQPQLDLRAFESAAGRPSPALASALEADGFGRGHPLARFRAVERVEVRVNDEGEFSAFALDLGGAPVQALARGRVDLVNPSRAQVCALSAGGVEILGDPSEARARIPFGPEGASFFGHGWHAPERDGPVEFRWTAEAEAELLVPLARAAALRVRLLAMPPESGEPPTLELRVNGVATEARAMRQGWAFYEWTAPETAWRPGLNEVVLRASRVLRPGGGRSGDTRALGVAVGQLHLERAGS